jgi:choline dehydrogenase-like flavoprotein
MWQYSVARFNALYSETIIKAKNIHLYTYANVVDLKANESVSEIEEVVVKNYAGKTHTVKAKQFIMACGAIQNARMLLASNSQAPQGLGNDNDIVGRYFMEHLEVASAELWLFKPFPTNLYTWEYGVTKASAELAITEKVQIENKILNGTASLNPLSFMRHAKPRMETWQDEDPRKSSENMFSNWKKAAAEAEKDNKGSISRAYELSTRIEQAPNRNSRVTISTEKDELGVPRATLHWALTALDKRSIRRIYQIIGQQIGIAGLGRVNLLEFLRDENDNSFPNSTNGGWHHMGTTRMNTDPKKGVVNADCQVHGINNLYVAGSGCYPTSGAPNPTLTLVALSLRLSDFVKEKLSRSNA